MYALCVRSGHFVHFRNVANRSSLINELSADLPMFRTIKDSGCASGARAIRNQSLIVCGPLLHLPISSSWAITIPFPRRKFLHLAACAAAVPGLPRLATALDYPNRPVRFVVEFFAGSLSDIIARTIAQGLSNQLGQQVIVDDQPGAGGNLATSLVVRQAPDGYTLLEATSSNVWNEILYDNLSFDFVQDVRSGRDYFTHARCYGGHSIVPGKDCP